MNKHDYREYATAARIAYNALTELVGLVVTDILDELDDEEFDAGEKWAVADSLDKQGKYTVTGSDYLAIMDAQAILEGIMGRAYSRGQYEGV